MGKLRDLLEAGRFVVTSECGPPKGADRGVIERKGKILMDHVDAVNVTDNQTAIVRMSSLCSCVILKELGIEPVLQMTVRDRNRIALQSDILGAAALGIENVLCLSGDHQCFGNQPHAMGVFDLDSIQLISTLRVMRDEAKIIGGDALSKAPLLFIGAAANPFADPLEFRVLRLAKKVKAGAQFIQTQCIYDVSRFKRFMSLLDDQGLLDKVHILGGITPLKSAVMARYMASKVSGMLIPEEIIKRLDGLPKERQRQEGIKIAVETIEQIKEIKGVKGIHLMAIEWEEVVPEIVNRAGLDKRHDIKGR